MAVIGTYRGNDKGAAIRDAVQPENPKGSVNNVEYTSRAICFLWEFYRVDIFGKPLRCMAAAMQSGGMRTSPRTRSERKRKTCEYFFDRKRKQRRNVWQELAK